MESFKAKLRERIKASLVMQMHLTPEQREERVEELLVMMLESPAAAAERMQPVELEAEEPQGDAAAERAFVRGQASGRRSAAAPNPPGNGPKER